MTPDERILVVANETVGGRALIDAVKRHADQGPVRVKVICPQNQPKEGWVVYDESVRDAAENRLKMTLAQLREVGIAAEGEVMDPDPYSAIMDALQEDDYDEVIISTHPETRSGWLRKDLVSRVEGDSGLPVEHVVVDLDRDREAVAHTLVVANQTVDTQNLFEVLKRKAAEGPHSFTVICPQSEHGDPEAPNRLAHMLKHMEDEGLEAVGQVMHPDPFTSIQNALQFYAVDEIVISTFPDEKSGWLRGGLIERVQAATSKPVEHVVAEVSPEDVKA
jgi:hypothetical protein